MTQQKQPTSVSQELQLSDFFSRPQANEGKKLPLYLPDGRKTEHYLIIRGADSDAFREAEMLAQQDLLAQIQKEQEEDLKPDTKFRKNNRNKLKASLIAGWSLPDEFSYENALKLIEEFPSLGDQIDRFANDRKRFFSQPSEESENSPEESSN